MPLQYPAEIGDRSGVNFTLFRNRFGIDLTNGAIDGIKLRCEKKYLFFKYHPDVEYSIGNAKDQCSIEVVGNPGTKFVLRQ